MTTLLLSSGGSQNDFDPLDFYEISKELAQRTLLCGLGKELATRAEISGVAASYAANFVDETGG